MKTIFIICTLMTIGIFTGVTSDFFVHEMGHYIFASIINSSAIEGLYFYPENLILNPFDNRILTIARVSYKSSIIESFGFHGGLLVTFAGFLFEVIFLVLVIISIKKYQKKKVKKNITIFLLGVLLGIMMTISSSWINDFTIIFNSLFGNIFLTRILILIVLFSVVYLSIYIFWKLSINFFIGFIPRRSKHRS